jgi:hypothetical protein
MRNTASGFSLLLACCAGLAANGCPAPTNPTEGFGTFEGLYLQGFEVSAFTVCGAGAPSSSTGYWLAGNAEFNDRYNALATTRGSNAFGPTVYAKFSGTLSDRGRFGHLGAYSREITVKQLVTMEVRDKCP